MQFKSELLQNSRKIWLSEADWIESADPLPLVILLDGEYYVERMDTVERLKTLSKRGLIRPANYAFVSHIDGQTRWRESFCNNTFAEAIGTELVPFLRQQFTKGVAKIVIGGLSLTGLAAAHAALAGPISYHGVIAQSGSFWWSENWLPLQVPTFSHRETKFRMCCGDEEVAAPVDHGDGLLQSTDQLTANEMMRDALLNAGFDVDFDIFHGGHKLEPWAADLPDALRSVLPPL